MERVTSDLWDLRNVGSVLLSSSVGFAATYFQIEPLTARAMAVGSVAVCCGLLGVLAIALSAAQRARRSKVLNHIAARMERVSQGAGLT